MKSVIPIIVAVLLPLFSNAEGEELPTKDSPLDEAIRRHGLANHLGKNLPLQIVEIDAGAELTVKVDSKHPEIGVLLKDGFRLSKEYTIESPSPLTVYNKDNRSESFGTSYSASRAFSSKGDFHELVLVNRSREKLIVLLYARVN